MSLLGAVSDFFGLDIGTTALRAVQLKGSGAIKTLENYGQLGIDGNLTISDAPVDRQKVSQRVLELVRQLGLTTKNVAVNIPSQKVFTTVVDMDRLSSSDLAKTIRYQAESFIPTPIASSKIDWAMIGDSPKDPKKVEILLSSISNEFVEARMDMLETIGLNVIAIEPDSLALARAIVSANTTTPQMALDMGNATTDLVIVMNGVPHLTRAIPIGSHTIVQAAMHGLAIEAAQAEDFVMKFGLSRDKLEGRIYNAVIGPIDNLVTEVQKSIRFFESRYTAYKLDRVIVTGGASAMPELPVYLANKLGLNVEIGNAWRNVSIPSRRENELMAVSNHFAVAVGLAERDL